MHLGMFYAALIAALVPLLVGFIWYNPAVLGKAWQQASGLKDEDLAGSNMLVVFALTYFFSVLIAGALLPYTIHQMHIQSLLIDTPDFQTVGSPLNTWYVDFMKTYGENFRTFKHGALHGFLASLFFAFPIFAINAMFERKSWKYIFINAGYWAVSLTIMGGLVCWLA